MERLNPMAVLVRNEPGVLARVAGLLARRGFNIHSLAVGETESPDVSRMSIVVSGDGAVREQAIKQLRRLVDVIRVTDLTGRPHVERGLALIKVAAPSERRSAIIELANIFRAAITHVDPGSMIVEVSGNRNKIEAMIDMMRPFGILEMVRTGQIVMARGQAALRVAGQSVPLAGDEPEPGQDQETNDNGIQYN
ncbi:MAG: acetolactate synthase small subunit [Desulfarculus sp.]|nr:acetolactate synthase small subunit [Desulfarculus sp.]